MEKENPHRQFDARLDETIARMTLSAQQIKQAREQISKLANTVSWDINKKPLLESVYKLAGAQEDTGQIVTDIYWINALLAIGIPTKKILKAWDVKDNLSLNVRDFIREQVEKEKSQE